LQAFLAPIAESLLTPEAAATAGRPVKFAAVDAHAQGSASPDRATAVANVVYLAELRAKAAAQFLAVAAAMESVRSGAGDDPALAEADAKLGEAVRAAFPAPVQSMPDTDWQSDPPPDNTDPPADERPLFEAEPQPEVPDPDPEFADPPAAKSRRKRSRGLIMPEPEAPPRPLPEPKPDEPEIDAGGPGEFAPGRHGDGGAWATPPPEDHGQG